MLFNGKRGGFYHCLKEKRIEKYLIISTEKDSVVLF